jgi:hypothetical protein
MIELERCGRKWSQPNFRIKYRIRLEGLGDATKSSVRIVGIWLENRTGNLPNTSTKALPFETNLVATMTLMMIMTMSLMTMMMMA